MASYATVTEIAALKRSLSVAETERAEALIPVISGIVAATGTRYGVDVDEEIEADAGYEEIVKAVVIGMVLRELDTPAGQLPVTQQSESAGGYSLSYTMPNASGAIRLWPSDLKALGFLRQRYGVIDFYGVDDV